MELLEEVEALKRVPLFAKLEPSKLKLLAFTSESLTFDEGETLFRAGDPADAAYVIMNGQVDILAETEAGEIPVGTLKAGQLVGEMGVLTNEPRSATIRAGRDLVALRVREDMFLKLLAENPEVALDVMRQLSAKLQLAQHQYEMLQTELQKTPGRAGTVPGGELNDAPPPSGQ